MGPASASQHERFRFADRAALAEKIRALPADIPLSDDVGVLLEPLAIAGHELPNRFVVQPMEGRDAGADGGPGPLTMRRYERYAAGGSGLIWFEATAVVPAGRAHPAQLHLHRANVRAFSRLVSATRAAARAVFGEHHKLMLILQLTHSGRQARPDGTRCPIIAQRNAILDPVTGVSADHALVTDEELDQLQQAYVNAAGLAAEAGFDGVDIKACHGYLVSELLAAFTRGDSRYGGTFENRARFLLEVVRKIRAAIPSLVVTSRFSAHDGIPHPYGFGADAAEPPGEQLDEPCALARALRDLGCPLLNVSIGNPYYNPHYGRPFDKPLAGAKAPSEHPLMGIARLLRVTAAIQQAVPEIPVVGTGYSWLRQFIPQVGAAAVMAGQAALIGLGRAAFAYPDCVKDLATRGAFDPQRTCIGCSGCSQIMRDGGSAGCIVHDREVYAAQYKHGRRRAAQVDSESGPR
ncbi:MAG: hypothetical protein KKB50_04140 [Planctomycetes bacterium]|nr:hypothetical protein [Planctomycetota bacterium]